MSTERIALEQLYRAVLSIWGDPEDCEECEALEETGNSPPCRVCGSDELFKATKAAEEALGPCQCGHPSSQHEDEDTTRCKVCECPGFKIDFTTGVRSTRREL